MSILLYLKHPSEYTLQRDGENQWLRRLATLPRGQSFFFFPLAFTLGGSQLLETPVSGDETPSSGLPGCLYPWTYTHIYAHNYKNKNRPSKFCAKATKRLNKSPWASPHYASHLILQLTALTSPPCFLLLLTSSRHFWKTLRCPAQISTAPLEVSLQNVAGTFLVSSLKTCC